MLREGSLELGGLDEDVGSLASWQKGGRGGVGRGTKGRQTHKAGMERKVAWRNEGQSVVAWQKHSLAQRDRVLEKEGGSV